MLKKQTYIIAIGAVNLLLINPIAFANANINTNSNINTLSTYYKTGFYIGGQVGHNDTNYSIYNVLKEAINQGTESPGAAPSTYSVFTGNIKTTGNGGRIFSGYQFNPYFAAEIGYTQFSKTTFNGFFYNPNNGQSKKFYQGELTENAVDLTGKLTLPLEYGFGVYLKGGAELISAYREVNKFISSTPFSNPNNIQLLNGTNYGQYYQTLRPVYGAGIDYTIPDTHLDIDLSYTETSGGGSIPKTMLTALGLSYKFSDYYYNRADNTESMGCSAMSGFYMGLQAGRTDTYQDSRILANLPEKSGNNLLGLSSTINNQGIGGRIFLGYQFNPYLATELGYTRFNQNSISAVQTYLNNGVTAYSYQGDIKEHAFDLSEKLMLPLQYNFSPYVKAGAAYISSSTIIDAFQDFIQDGPGNTLPVKAYTIYLDKTSQAIRPLLGAGIDYRIPNTDFNMGVSYTEILGGGDIPRANLIALGIEYKFV